MQVSTRHMILSLGGIGCGIALLSAPLFGQQAARRRATPVVIVATEHVAFTDQAIDVANPNPVEPDPAAVAEALVNTISDATSGLMTFRVVPGEVEATTSATLYETRPESRYMWAFRVFDPTRKTKFVEKFYVDQIFTPPLRLTITPTFSESVKLQPGRYYVYVTLYQFSEGFDLTKLHDPEVAKSYSVVAQGEEVVVPR